LREVLELAGVDVSIFYGHSVRGASTSVAAGAGITTNNILKAADWSSDSVFRRFYYCQSMIQPLVDLYLPLASLDPNASDHAMIACYLELYEEGEVKHINGPTHPTQQQRFGFKRSGCDHTVGYS